MEQKKTGLQETKEGILSRIKTKIENDRRTFGIAVLIYSILAFVFLIFSFAAKEGINNRCMGCLVWSILSICFLGMIRSANIPPSTFSFGSNSVKKFYYYLNKPKEYLKFCWIIFCLISVCFVVSFLSLICILI